VAQSHKRPPFGTKSAHGARARLCTLVDMGRSAPRYDPRLLEALLRLDDRAVPIAEVGRRLGRAADELGLTRPSYVHVRRLVTALREWQDDEAERRRALRGLAVEVATDVALARWVNAYEVAARVAEIRDR